MEKSSFFNSVNGDRKYQAADFAAFFNSLLTNGVFPNPGTNLQVISNSNMTVAIKAGKAWINGYCYINDSDLILPIAVADGVLKRIDRIVVRFDTVGRLISTVVKKGTFASSPVAPTLQRDADGYELGIGDILISNGAVSITQTNITDLRMNTSLCGWVNSLIQADTTVIFNQYLDWFTSQSENYTAQMAANEATFEADFLTWFAGIQNTLGTNVAGNLLNLINENASNLTDLESDVIAHSIDYTKQIPYIVSTGTPNTYQIALPIAALTAGMAVAVKFNTDSTGASTLDWDGKGAKGIKKADGSDVTNLKSTGIYTLRYDGINFLLQGEGGSGNAVASDLYTGKKASTDAGDIIGINPYKVTSDILYKNLTPSPSPLLTTSLLSTPSVPINSGQYPVVDKVTGDLYVGTRSLRGIIKLDNNLNVLWYFGRTAYLEGDTGDMQFLTLSADGNHLYFFRSVSNIIQKITTNASHALVWTYSLPSSRYVYHMTLGGDGYLYVSSSDGSVFKLSEATGLRTDILIANVNSAITCIEVIGTNLYLGGRVISVYGLHKYTTSGVLVWHDTSNSSNVKFIRHYGNVIFVNDTVKIRKVSEAGVLIKEVTSSTYIDMDKDGYINTDKYLYDSDLNLLSDYTPLPISYICIDDNYNMFSTENGIISKYIQKSIILK